MFAVQNLAKVAPRIASTAVQQARNNHHVVAKPRNRVPFAEKIGHGLFMTFASMLIPIIVATNFNKWREARGE